MQWAVISTGYARLARLEPAGQARPQKNRDSEHARERNATRQHESAEEGMAPLHEKTRHCRADDTRAVGDRMHASANASKLRAGNLSSRRLRAGSSLDLLVAAPKTGRDHQVKEEPS